MALVITIAQQKGGAGKTTLASNLASLWSMSRRVALLDIDPQRSLSRWLSLRRDNLPEAPVNRLFRCVGLAAGGRAGTSVEGGGRSDRRHTAADRQRRRARNPGRFAGADPGAAEHAGPLGCGRYAGAGGKRAHAGCHHAQPVTGQIEAAERGGEGDRGKRAHPHGVGSGQPQRLCTGVRARYGRGRSTAPIARCRRNHVACRRGGTACRRRTGGERAQQAEMIAS